MNLFKYSDGTFEIVGYCSVGSQITPNSSSTITIDIPIDVYGANSNDINKNTVINLSYWGDVDSFFIYNHWMRTRNTLDITAKNLGARTTSAATKIYIRGLY